jgi:hypothetical protein
MFRVVIFLGLLVGSATSLDCSSEHIVAEHLTPAISTLTYFPDQNVNVRFATSLLKLTWTMVLRKSYPLDAEPSHLCENITGGKNCADFIMESTVSKKALFAIQQKIQDCEVQESINMKTMVEHLFFSSTIPESVPLNH